MNLNPIRWLEWIITEHGSASILRERIGYMKDRHETTEMQHAEDMTRLKQKHVEEIARLNRQHYHAMTRIVTEYSEGRGIMVPPGILRDGE